MRRAARIDNNQPEIVAALRAIGASVEPIHFVGRGVPDLLVGYRGETYVLEVKSTRGELTDDEREWHEAWRGQVDIVRSPEEAFTAIGAEVW